MKLFVGNLNKSLKESDLEAHFKSHGVIGRAAIARNGKDGESRGYGYVEVPDEDNAEGAILLVDGTPLLGRRLNVELARSS